MIGPVQPYCSDVICFPQGSAGARATTPEPDVVHEDAAVEALKDVSRELVKKEPALKGQRSFAMDISGAYYELPEFRNAFSKIITHGMKRLIVPRPCGQTRMPTGIGSVALRVYKLGGPL